MRWPSPLATEAARRSARCGRTWLVPPAPTTPCFTSDDWLAETVAASLLHLIHEDEALGPP